MAKRSNWQEFKAILDQHNIQKLYHFTDRDNLKAIIENGGLYSWKDCEMKGIAIPKPGGGGPGSTSWSIDAHKGLENYVRLSFTRNHPMMYVAMNENRISNPVILEIAPEVLYDESTLYSNINANRNGANIGNTLDHFKAIHFNTVKAPNYFDLDKDELPYFQAEILIKNHLPLSRITNIANFGIPIPAQPQVLQTTKPAYSARIDREHPTAFIFLVDHSVSMSRKTIYNGEYKPMSEAVARIVNNQINELVERCVKNDETRHYFDIAIIGYGDEAYSAWNGALEGKDFVTPDEIRNNPFKKITVKEEVKTRKGVSIKEVEKKQWMEARADGRWTRMDKALKRAGSLLETWMKTHQNRDCYPPTIINITDGEYNGTTDDTMLQLANEVKSMFTNDGNVLLYNFHIATDDNSIEFPAKISDLNGDGYAERLFNLSTLLPLTYNDMIEQIFAKNIDKNTRHRAMAVNAGMERLSKMMKIGTYTSINNQNQ